MRLALVVVGFLADFRSMEAIFEHQDDDVVDLLEVRGRVVGGSGGVCRWLDPRRLLRALVVLASIGLCAA